MAKNFRRVQMDIHYRHLGDELYHAGFLYDKQSIHGRSAVRNVRIYAFALPGLAWAEIFGSDIEVRSPHRTVLRSSGCTSLSGKDSVRAKLLYLVRHRVARREPVPGFNLLWSNDLKGTRATVVVEMTKVSHRLTEMPVESMWNLAKTEGTRCPECNQTECTPTCPGVR